ncbi:MAG: TolC family protein [Oligoflexales bacterium]|nr:TolC family protein [Oligoflexales bacterium]
MKVKLMQKLFKLMSESGQYLNKSLMFGGSFLFLAFSQVAQGQKSQQAGATDIRRITLGEAQSMATSVSPLVRQAQADLESQTERRRGAWSNVGPKLKGEYSDVRFEDKQTAQFGPQEIVIRDDKSQTGSLTLVQPITGFWALTDRARFEGVQEEMKGNTLNLTKSDTLFFVTETYLRASLMNEMYRIAQASITSVDSQLRDAKALERVGRINRGDVLRLELAVSESKARAAEAKAARDITLANLRESLGLSPGTDFEIDTVGETSFADIPQTVETAYQMALERRLETKQSKLGVKSAEFGKNLAYTGFTPSISAFVKWDHNFGEPTGLAGTDKDTRTYGIKLEWDLWNNGAGVFAVREAVAQMQKAEAASLGLDQQIRLDVYQAFANLQAARESLALAEVAVSQAEEAYRIEKARFSTGSRSATDLVLAETAQVGARGRLVSGRTNVLVWRLKLQRAVGSDQPKL